MKRTQLGRVLFSLGALLVALGSANAAEGAQKVENFVLLDQNGAAHELYYQRDASAIVLIVHGNGCQIVSSNAAAYNALSEEFAAQGVQVLMINSNLQDMRAQIRREAAEYGINVPILDDRTQIVGRALGLDRTGEVLVINPDNWEVVYRGPLDDRVSFERQKKQASKHYVRDVLEKLVDGESVAFEKVSAPGCIINFEEMHGAQISYAKTIAPMLKDNCVACHIEGGIAPWAMSEYTMVKGFAPMMREVIRTKRMPPWHADPEIGHWSNDAGLSDAETKTLIAWIEAGAPRGEGEDPLKAVAPLDNRWTLGEPDLILDIPAFEVPATGIVDYQFPTVPNPTDKDVWVVAAAIIPGDPKAVHHILAGSSEKPVIEDSIESIFENFILTYAPGNEASRMPQGTGVFVPKGGVYQFQMHYTPYGKKSIDRSKIGLYFSDTPPDNFYREHVIFNPRIAIPAEADRHEERAYFDFARDATIHALFPHAHYRGRSSEFELEYPDGSKEVILSVPNYDFNWQRTYNFTEPKNVPAGTRIVHRTIYDNSANNLGNPDPQEVVRWGLQSEQEMLYGSMGYSWTDETTAQPIHDPVLAQMSQLMGFIDADMDGVASKEEMPDRMLKSIGDNWSKLDRDADGGLNIQELVIMMKSRQHAQSPS
ncbi:redoxin domain-containing protein [Congregibacter variabilis]|uniref:Redoxin domain-containing protein n=1 Tax=Congregibacter variabilis TaxID=3081200 RepID=A0ABZ0I274_9GAMM|nr:redoxin domain-containing protein [Congregibacter sp. IMCC43200]